MHRGLEPAPERSRKISWKDCLAQHWELIVAADFFTIEVWTVKGPQRFSVPDGLLARKRYLIHDRDALFTADFLLTLKVRAAAGLRACGTRGLSCWDRQA